MVYGVVEFNIKICLYHTQLIPCFFFAKAQRVHRTKYFFLLERFAVAKKRHENSKYVNKVNERTTLLFVSEEDALNDEVKLIRIQAKQKLIKSGLISQRSTKKEKIKLL